MIDPVCGMSVTEQSPHRAHHGARDFYFCSAGCQAKFTAEPARYAGANATDRDKIDKLLRELERVRATDDRRHARFRCVVALARNGDLLGMFEGTVHGRITDTARGDSGFGYDPIFVPDGFEQTFGELSEEVKNTISHRAKAIRALADRLQRLEFGG